MPDDEYIPSNAATRIKTLRRRLKLSQQQFADLINVSVTFLKQWENGQAQPSVSYWQRILLAETEGMQSLSGDGATPRRVYESAADYILEADAEEPLAMDFSANPDVVRTFVEGERLVYGHLFNR